MPMGPWPGEFSYSLALLLSDLLAILLPFVAGFGLPSARPPFFFFGASCTDNCALRQSLHVQVILTRTEAAEVRALQRRAAKASPPRDTAFMHSSTPYVAPRPVSYRPEAKGLPRWNV